MEAATQQVELELRTLIRRVQAMRQRSAGEVEVEGSAYDILLRLVDGGPARLSTLASEFELDPSTITRQVQALERSGLAERERDPDDGRAAILRASETGRGKLERSRAWRERRLTAVLARFTEHDRSELARLLTQFNASAREVQSRSEARPVLEAQRST